MNRKLLPVIGVIYLVLLVGLATRNGMMLALLFPILLYLGLGLLYGPRTLKVSLQREISAHRVKPGIPVEVSMTLTNQGDRLEFVEIHDQVPEGLTLLKGHPSRITALEKGESIRLNYVVEGPRGYYNFQDVQIATSDTFALYQQSVLLADQKRLYVQPEIQQVSRIKIRPRATRSYAGFIPARKGGPGVEFFGVRQYQPGDPLRWINWRASARHQQHYFINQFEQQRVADVGVILDTRLRSEIKLSSGASLFEYSVQAAAAIANSFLQDGNRVGLLLYGTQLDWTIPGYGKIQGERIMQSLARAKPGTSLVFEDLRNIPTRLFPPSSQLVLISPLHENDIPILINLRARGYTLLVISPNPVGFELTDLNQEDPQVRLAARIARVERSLMIHKLRQAGVRALDWDLDQALENALHVALSRPIPQVHIPRRML